MCPKVPLHSLNMRAFSRSKYMDAKAKIPKAEEMDPKRVRLWSTRRDCVHDYDLTMGATKRPHTYRLIALLRSKCSSAALRRSGAQHMTATEAAISFPCHAAVPASLLTSARQSSTIICCCWTVINPYGYGCCRLPERNQAPGGSEPAGICDVSVEQLHALVWPT